MNLGANRSKNHSVWLLATGVAMVLLLAAMWIVRFAKADATLCSGPSFSSCISVGYTAHGYDSNYNNSYWRAYAGHNCTNYVGYMLSIGWAGDAPFPMGNGSDWDESARSMGRVVDGNPAVGSIAQWNAGGGLPYGHVAYVERVDANSITISEDNYPAGPFRWRVISRGSAAWPSNFLHIKDVSQFQAIKTLNVDYNRDGVPDIYTFQKNDAGSNSTALRIINGSNPQQWLLQTGTVLGRTDSQWDFAADDFNRDGTPDIYAVQRYDAGSNGTAVRVINGANPQQWLLQTGTILGKTDGNWSFAVGDYNQDGTPDVYAFNRNDVGSGKTSVHIVDGSNMNRWLLQTPLVMGPVSLSTEFGVGDYNRDGTPDIYAIQRDDAGSNSTAVRIINGANPQQWLLQTGTILGKTDGNWSFRIVDYNRDSIPDIYAIQRDDAGSNSTAIRIIDGSNMSRWLLQTGTVLGKTDRNWVFN